MERLSLQQLRMLIAMDDGDPPDESVGVIMQSLNGHEIRSCDSLVDRGLARFWMGRFEHCYYTLTHTGRAVLRDLCR
jgi:hypothetical protein